MSFDRFQNDSREDRLMRDKSARECAEIRDQLAREEKEDAEMETERAMAEDPPQPEHFRPAPGVARDLWDIFTSKP